jgi:hypothetical protein
VEGCMAVGGRGCCRRHPGRASEREAVTGRQFLRSPPLALMSNVSQQLLSGAHILQNPQMARVSDIVGKAPCLALRPPSRSSRWTTSRPDFNAGMKRREAR